MKKVSVTVQYDEEKLNTVKIFLEKKGLNISDEIVKFIDGLYTTSLDNLLEDLRAARNDPDSFDLSIADALCDFYEPSEVCDMLTDDQKELVVIGVENERDWYNPVLKNLVELYDCICEEQSEEQHCSMEM